MKGQYAGDKLIEILQKEDEVVDAWKALLNRVTGRSLKLGQSDEYQRLIIMIQNLLLWIEDMRLQIESDDQPKYVLSDSSQVLNLEEDDLNRVSNTIFEWLSLDFMQGNADKSK